MSLGSNDVNHIPPKRYPMTYLTRPIEPLPKTSYDFEIP